MRESTNNPSSVLDFCVPSRSLYLDGLDCDLVEGVCFVVVIISIWPDSRQLSVASQGSRTVFCEATAFSGSAKSSVLLCRPRESRLGAPLKAVDEHLCAHNQR